MNLVVDIGNTRIKAGLFEGSGLLEQRWPQDQAALQQLVEDQSVEAIIVASVAESAEELRRTMRTTVPCIILEHHTPLPLVTPTLR